MSNLTDLCLVFVLDEHMSLSQWDEYGILGRETALYRRLANSFGKVLLVSHGGPEDLGYATRLDGIDLVCNNWRLKNRIYHGLLPYLVKWKARHWKHHLVKTNQMPGVALAYRLATALRAHFVIRCGYHYRDFLELEFGENSRQAAKAREIEFAYFPKANHSIVTSESFRQRLMAEYGIGSDKISVVPNFVDMELFSPGASIRNEMRSIAFVGRLAEQKNLPALIAALSGLGIVLEIAGAGPLEGSLKHLASQLGVPVRFHGRLRHEELPAFLGKSDAFVLPSTFEGHPKSLLEAMSFGMPVIGSNVPGVRECIHDGVTGLLCNPDSQSLALAIKALASDAELRRRLGNAAREAVASHLSLEAIHHQETDIYKRLLASSIGFS